MLFDTSSPGRKRVLRVVYGFLAVLFLVGFVGFGIGNSNSGGGILDALGITDSGGGGGGGDSAFEQQIQDTEKRVQKHPQNANALTSLVNLHFRAAVADYQENQSIDDARPELEASVDAWERYLKTDPKQPSAAAAPFAAQAYQALGDLEGAAKAQRVVVDAHPQTQQYFQLAAYYYADADFKNGGKIADEAISKAKGKSKAKVKKQFAQLQQKARKQAKALKAQSQAQAGGGQGGAGGGLEDPFGGLQGAGGGLGGATAPTP